MQSRSKLVMVFPQDWMVKFIFKIYHLLPLWKFSTVSTTIRGSNLQISRGFYVINFLFLLYFYLFKLKVMFSFLRFSNFPSLNDRNKVQNDGKADTNLCMIWFSLCLKSCLLSVLPFFSGFETGMDPFSICIVPSVVDPLKGHSLGGLKSLFWPFYQSSARSDPTL